MKFKELDVVSLKKDCKNVNEGEVGTIVMAFDTPNEAYEVEFLYQNGHTKAICTLLPEDLELV